MPVRANLERPDYISGVGQSLGGIANVVDQLSPMDPRLQRAIFEVIGGGDPKRVAASLRGGMQAPEMPSAQPAAGGRQMQMPADQAAGDVQHLFPMTNLRAPRVPSRPGFSEDVTVTAPSAPAAEKPAPELPLAPFARRDAPMLMQLAQVAGKHNDPIAMLRLGLSERRLKEDIRKFDAQEGLRSAREDLARAQTEGIPQQIELAKKRVRQADARLILTERGLDLGQRRLLSGELEKVLRATSGAKVAVSTFSTLLERAKDPKNAPGEFDYDLRRSAQMLSALPFGTGKLFEEGLEHTADSMLTPAQLAFRRQTALGMQDFIASNYGKTLTGNELKLARQLAGQQLSIRDTIAALEALSTHLRNKIQMYERAYPEASGIIGQPGEELPALPEGEASGSFLFGSDVNAEDAGPGFGIYGVRTGENLPEMPGFDFAAPGNVESNLRGRKGEKGKR